jgi:hypothetical protein
MTDSGAPWGRCKPFRCGETDSASSSFARSLLRWLRFFSRSTATRYSAHDLTRQR